MINKLSAAKFLWEIVGNLFITHLSTHISEKTFYIINIFLRIVYELFSRHFHIVERVVHNFYVGLFGYIGKILLDVIVKELMADKYTTIDALPPGHSRRYAERAGQTDERFIRESSIIPEKTTIAPATPYYAPHSEFDYLFGAFPSFTNASTIASFTTSRIPQHRRLLYQDAPYPFFRIGRSVRKH